MIGRIWHVVQCVVHSSVLFHVPASYGLQTQLQKANADKDVAETAQKVQASAACA